MSTPPASDPLPTPSDLVASVEALSDHPDPDVQRLTRQVLWSLGREHRVEELLHELNGQERAYQSLLELWRDAVQLIADITGEGGEWIAMALGVNPELVPDDARPFEELGDL